MSIPPTRGLGWESWPRKRPWEVEGSPGLLALLGGGAQNLPLPAQTPGFSRPGASRKDADVSPCSFLPSSPQPCEVDVVPSGYRGGNWAQRG